MPEESTTPDLVELTRRQFELLIAQTGTRFLRPTRDAVWEMTFGVAMRFLDAYSLGASVERGLAVFTPDVVLDPFPEWVEDSDYRGEDGVRRPSAVWTDTFDEFAIELSEARDLDDRVVILGETTGQIKATGVPIRQPVGAVFSKLRDGRIGEAHFFGTWEQALRSVGLEE